MPSWSGTWTLLVPARGGGAGDARGLSLSLAGLAVVVAVAATATAGLVARRWRAGPPPNRGVRHASARGAEDDDDAASVRDKVADLRRAWEEANRSQSRDADFRAQQVSLGRVPRAPRH